MTKPDERRIGDADHPRLGDLDEPHEPHEPDEPQEPGEPQLELDLAG